VLSSEPSESLTEISVVANVAELSLIKVVAAQEY
jgi:hypothetical protein